MFGRKDRKTPLRRKPITSLEDLRDDCIALFLNSGMTQKQVHEQGGPTPATITKWLYKETVFPRLDTIRSIMQVLGADLVAMPRNEVEQFKGEYDIAGRLGLSISVDSRPKMPPRKKARMIRQKARQRVDQ